MLHYVDELTVAELADEMGRTPKAVEALLTRARRALRHELEGSDA
jgi:DNA-directed RNA polymerase specialized sigma24 family protein